MRMAQCECFSFMMRDLRSGNRQIWLTISDMRDEATIASRCQSYSSEVMENKNRLVRRFRSSSHGHLILSIGDGTNTKPPRLYRRIRSRAWADPLYDFSVEQIFLIDPRLSRTPLLACWRQPFLASRVAFHARTFQLHRLRDLGDLYIVRDEDL